MDCRFCGSKDLQLFIDLGMAPPSNSFLEKEDLMKNEKNYPLKINICENCLLVQAEEYKKHHEIFNEDYVYFSSFSDSWLKHAKKYVEMICRRQSLDKNSLVIEIASNDGYLLQYFEQKKIPCIGVEPTKNTAEAAMQKGIETIMDFFGENLAKKLVSNNQKADLIIGNNVLAHTPYINDFVGGVKIALKPNGICTFEFPHILNLIEKNQFDTIYHEHFSYFSLYSVYQIFTKHGLQIFDVEELETHGGSLRIYARHKKEGIIEKTNKFRFVWDKEKQHRLHELAGYKGFKEKAEKVKAEFVEFIVGQKQKGKTIAGYGAAAKGNTLLNYANIENGMIGFVVDKSPYKQGKYLPGSKIPVVDEDFLKQEKPDFIVVFPWNIKSEIMAQLHYIKEWGAKFVVAVPELKIF